MAKKAAVINDLSGFGKCSLNAAIAVLSAFGIQPCSIPTAILTNQTQFPIYKTVDFTEHMPDYIDIWKKNNASFDGIYSGYIANSKQVDFITEFIDTFKDTNTLVRRMEKIARFRAAKIMEFQELTQKMEAE